jgi:hypothetical protein
MLKIIAYVALAIAALTGAQSHAAALLNNPNASTIYLLQCKFAHVTPPYAAMAQMDDKARSADEFQRPEIIKRAEAGLRETAASLDGVDAIVVNLGSRFSEFDTQYNEYDFDINDGSFIPYNAFGRQMRLALTNGTKAQAWKLGVPEAEEVLRKNKGNRYATLVMTLSLMESPPATDGEPMILNAKIVRYDVLTQFGNVKLGSETVEDTH